MMVDKLNRKIRFASIYPGFDVVTWNHGFDAADLLGGTAGRSKTTG